jgi:hypothetical protein
VSKTPKQPKTPAELASSMLEAGLNGLQSYVDKVAAIVKESRDVDAADAFARLLTKIAQVSAELRKSDAEERRRADLNTPEAIIAAIRGLSAREKQTVQGELERMTATRSGLS